MVRLDIMSRHDRAKQRYFCVWTNCPNVRAKKIICVWSTIERNGGNKSEWIDRLSEPADGKDVEISAWHRFVSGRNPDVDMVVRVGRKYD